MTQSTDQENHAIAVIDIDTLPEDEQNISQFFDRVLTQVSKKLDHKSVAQTFVNTIEQTKKLFKRTGVMLQEERTISVSQESVNGLLLRFVVEKLSILSHLTASFHDQQFTLHGSLETHGIKIDVSAEFSVESFVFNSDEQVMTYRQLTPTHIDSILFDSIMMHITVKLALWCIKTFKKRDFLGLALEKYKVATVTLPEHDERVQYHGAGEILTIDIQRYLRSDKNVRKALKRFNINNAYIADSRLQIVSKVNFE